MEDPQPEINVGMVGHVDHGKTTLVKALSGKWTDTHSEEVKRGITIRLGYADVAVYRCGKCSKLSVSAKCCGSDAVVERRIALVDAPGHESLMATMLCGANIMDGALLLVAANESCPQPQTREHLQALELIGMENVIIVQNKVDLVSDEQAKKNHDEIREFVKGTKYENVLIIPVSAFHNINVDVLLSEINSRFRTPVRALNKDPLMFVARSFDINRPGAGPEKLVGGVLGGVLKQGVLSVGDDIEILPGYQVEEKNVKVWKSLRTKITGLITGNSPVQSVRPGGNFGLQTSLDPSIVKSDQLVGSAVGLAGKLPPVWYDWKLEIHLLDRVVGSKDKLVVDPLKTGELLMLNVNSTATVGVVKDTVKGVLRCSLRRPVCAEVHSRVAISRSVGHRWRLIGFGTIS
jgi:translation initiation factor 2 subunit 3